MSSSDKRRKRKRILRQSLSLSCVRSVLLCFSFLTLLYLLSYALPFTCSAFRPVLVVSTLSLLSSSATTTAHLLDIQDRVLFPDHVLLLLTRANKDGARELECLYFSESDLIRGRNHSGVKKVLSIDEYDEFRMIVRCPLPFGNYSGEVNLRWHGENGISEQVKDSWSLNNWDNLAYAAAIDDTSVVVFVKGLNLRADRKSDPSQFSCHFALGKWKRTKALTAAQEVIRCALPRSLQVRGSNAHRVVEGIRVTIGMQQQLVPSVAKVSNLVYESRRREGEGKYELCVCTMVWNQGSAIREWIMYHAWLGVERWFVYDNNSDDGIDEVVRQLDRENYNISRHVWPWIKTQEAGFSHCAVRAKDECKWISFMDVDEYFYLPYSTPKHQRFRKLGYAGQGSLRTLVANVSSWSSAIAEIRTSCHSFGPSGLSAAPPQGVTVGYSCRLQSPERHKSMIRADALDPTLLNVVHHFHLKKGFKYLNLPATAAVINHYKYQVWEVFRAKFYRRVATYVADWQQNQNEGSRDRAPGLGTEAIEPPDWPQKFCEVWDTGLRDFVLANLADVNTGLLPWEAPAAQ
ncbi:glycosyltransferase family 92 protein RCOM_0530710-like [Salvia miltiorrhiza]|uniref:glycosyltransferase family 92 protein RCOM_0530710-like n=1 Tax=Salvia miltiorrhiza TaxID=226208 RepID=UPI0025AB7F2B|nr:glycosyltransferase family 92 protein RCOM_0530710-like [Salvia miltiorrhiza]